MLYDIIRYYTYILLCNSRPSSHPVAALWSTDVVTMRQCGGSNARSTVRPSRDLLRAGGCLGYKQQVAKYEYLLRKELDPYGGICQVE